METYLVGEIIRSLVEGNVTKFVAYIAIFFVIWVEVRGMKTQLKNLNETVSKSFEKGEKRFEALEKSNNDLEHRLTVLETRRG